MAAEPIIIIIGRLKYHNHNNYVLVLQNVVPINPVTDPRKIRRVIAEDPDWSVS